MDVPDHSPTAPPRSLWVAALLLLFGLYTTYFPLYSVGHFGDDARYVLLAQSLARGHYRAIDQPGQPPFTLYPPAFPALLTPFVAFCGGRWDPLKAVPIALTVFSIGLLWALARAKLPSWAAFWVALAFAINPVTARYSCIVMSESLFIALLLAALLLLQRLLTEDSNRSALGLGLVLGALALTRTTGFIVILVAGTTLILAGRHRSAVLALGVAMTLGSLFPLRNLLVAHEASAYLAPWAAELRQYGTIAALADNVNRVANAMFVNTLLAVHLPFAPWAFAVSALLTVAVAGVLAGSAARRPEDPEASRFSTWGLLALLIVWFAVHALWTSINLRYAWPMLPVLLLLAAEGARGWKDRLGPRAGRWLRAAGAALLALYAVDNGIRLRSLLEETRKPENRPPLATGAWIRTHTPADARFAYALPAQLYLYAQRSGAGYYFSADEAEFYGRLVAEGIGYVLVRRVDLQSSGRNAADAWLNNALWTATHPEHFREIYGNPSEGAFVFEVLRPKAPRRT